MSINFGGKPVKNVIRYHSPLVMRKKITFSSLPVCLCKNYQPHAWIERKEYGKKNLQ